MHIKLILYVALKIPSQKESLEILIFQKTHKCVRESLKCEPLTGLSLAFSNEDYNFLANLALICFQSVSLH